MSEINLDAINQQISEKYITARRHPTFPLTIYNYTAKAQYEKYWTPEVLICRGLILSDDRQIVARPFDKFFNWGEGNLITDAPIVNVTEKMDGSLGILYWWQNIPYIASRGSFDSEQALWATDFLHKNHDLDTLNQDLTFLFEIIYPDNRIVIDYQDKQALYLLGIRNHKTGEYCARHIVEYASHIYGFPLPRVYHFDNPLDIIAECEQLEPNNEGWVVEFADGQRFKFKGESYKELHRLISALSFKNTLECVASGNVNQLLEVIPDEFLGQIKEWIQLINNRVTTVKTEIELRYNEAPKNTRKDYALWVKTNCQHLSPYMFARLDNRLVDELIYKVEFQNN